MVRYLVVWAKDLAHYLPLDSDLARSEPDIISSYILTQWDRLAAASDNHLSELAALPQVHISSMTLEHTEGPP